MCRERQRIMSYRSSTVKGSTIPNFYTIQNHRSVGQRSLSAGNSGRWSHPTNVEGSKSQGFF